MMTKDEKKSAVFLVVGALAFITFLGVQFWAILTKSEDTTCVINSHSESASFSVSSGKEGKIIFVKSRDEAKEFIKNYEGCKHE